MQHFTKTSNMVGCITAVEHTLKVPLDWTNPITDATIDIFVREVYKTGSINISTIPAVLFLQGGPGFPSPRPSGPPSGWIKTLLDKGYRVLLLDQRGTGRSTAMTVQRLGHLAATKDGVSSQVEYLKNMRSDAIAADIDAIRILLCGSEGKISLLGQSFGGFCMLSYISRYSAHLDKCLFTCGLAPVMRDIREVYVATYRRLLTRNRRFYTRYPEDIRKVRDIVAYLHAHRASPVQLPGGGHLTVRRFLQLGIMLGMGSGMDALHFLLEDAFFVPPGYTTALSNTEGYNDDVMRTAVLNESFLYAVEAEQAGFESSPMYWLMHESIYMNGGGSISGWAAEEVMAYDEFRDAFDHEKRLRMCECTGVGSILGCVEGGGKMADGSHMKDSIPYINFTGEMVYSWMGDDYARLRPLKEAAHVLAAMQWESPLYDLQALAGAGSAAAANGACPNSMKCAALVSYDDMYVERTFSEETAALLGGEDVCRMWITNEFQHSGVRDDPARVVEMLLSMTKNEVYLPS